MTIAVANEAYNRAVVNYTEGSAVANGTGDSHNKVAAKTAHAHVVAEMAKDAKPAADESGTYLQHLGESVNSAFIAEMARDTAAVDECSPSGAYFKELGDSTNAVFVAGL